MLRFLQWNDNCPSDSLLINYDELRVKNGKDIKSYLQ